jgi:fibrillarin-like rRNA methylase
MKLGYSLLLVAIVSIKAYSQDITTVNTVWTSVETLMIVTGDRITEATQLTSYRKDHIVWADANNTVKYDFTVKETDGAWTDLQQPGSFIYEVEANGKSGNITFERTTAGVKARIFLLTDTDTEPLTCELIITAVDVQ